MPVIKIDGVGGTLSKEQKRRLCQVLTANASDITGISPEAFMVLIQEMNSDNIGGKNGLLSDKLNAKKEE